MLRGALLLWATLWGKGTSTVVRVSYYENSSDCTGGGEQITEYFGIPDAFGILDFDVCHGRNGSYVQYECHNSTVVYNMFTDADCTTTKDGMAVGVASDDTCRSNQTSNCDISDPDYPTSSPNSTVDVVEFSNPSCTGGGGAAKKYSMEDYVNPTTGSSGTCSPSELYDYNSKLVCVDKELKTFYYQNNDTTCTSSPTAVVTATPCLMVGEHLYHSTSCEDASIAEHEELPSLAHDATITSTYTYVQTYTTADCSVEETRMYLLGVTGGDQGDTYEYDLCSEFNETWDIMYTCNSAKISVSLFSADSSCSGSASANETLDDSCDEGERMSCTTTAPEYEGSTDDWQVSVARYDDSACVSSTGDEDLYTWTQFLSRVTSSDSSGSSTSTSSSLSWSIGSSISCSPSEGVYNSKVECVNGAIAFVVYPDTDTTCSGTPEMIVFVSDLCTEVDDTYGMVSCVSASDARAPHTSFWISGATAAAIASFLFAAL